MFSKRIRAALAAWNLLYTPSRTSNVKTKPAIIYSPSPNLVASCNMMTSSESFSSILGPFLIHLIPKPSISPEGLNDSAPTFATACDVFISLF